MPPTLSLSDPPASSAISGSISWVEGAALGSISTMIAIIAVAAIGLLMLAGRLELRRGITVVLGCFLLFGASGIAAAFVRLAGPHTPSQQIATPDQEELSDQGSLSAASPTAYDPYAGASVPLRRRQ